MWHSISLILMNSLTSIQLSVVNSQGRDWGKKWIFHVHFQPWSLLVATYQGPLLYWGHSIFRTFHLVKALSLPAGAFIDISSICHPVSLGTNPQNTLENPRREGWRHSGLRPRWAKCVKEAKYRPPYRVPVPSVLAPLMPSQEVCTYHQGSTWKTRSARHPEDVSIHFIQTWSGYTHHFGRGASWTA